LIIRENDPHGETDDYQGAQKEEYAHRAHDCAVLLAPQSTGVRVNWRPFMVSAGFTLGVAIAAGFACQLSLAGVLSDHVHQGGDP
jgi:hypothetical protein